MAFIDSRAAAAHGETVYVAGVQRVRLSHHGARMRIEATVRLRRGWTRLDAATGFVLALSGANGSHLSRGWLPSECGRRGHHIRCRRTDERAKLHLAWHGRVPKRLHLSASVPAGPGGPTGRSARVTLAPLR